MPRVALIQFAPLEPHQGDASLNLQRAHDLVRNAAQEGADLVTLPEYFLVRPSLQPTPSPPTPRRAPGSPPLSRRETPH